MELNFEGVVVGVMSLVIIGAFHPLVIWFEYHFTQRGWPVFFIAEKINRVMKIAQKSEVRIPMIKVVAKPCTGPVPVSYTHLDVYKRQMQRY